MLVPDVSSLLRSHPLNDSEYTAYAIEMLIYFLHFMIYIICVYFGWETPSPFTIPGSQAGPARNIHARMDSFELMSQVTEVSAYIHQSTTRLVIIYLPTCLPIYLSIYQSIHLSTYLSMHLIHLFIYLLCVHFICFPPTMFTT